MVDQVLGNTSFAIRGCNEGKVGGGRCFIQHYFFLFIVLDCSTLRDMCIFQRFPENLFPCSETFPLRLIEFVCLQLTFYLFFLGGGGPVLFIWFYAYSLASFDLPFPLQGSSCAILLSLTIILLNMYLVFVYTYILFSLVTH